MAELRKVSDDFLAAPQLAPEDFARAAEMGVRLIVNNRVEGEAPDQMPDDEARALAEAAGLSYVHIPVRMSSLSMTDVQAMAAAMKNADGPVLAYCLSGMRSAALWALVSATRDEEADSILSRTAAAGFDLSGLRQTLIHLNQDGAAP